MNSLRFAATAVTLAAFAVEICHAQMQHGHHHDHHTPHSAPAGVMYEHVHPQGEWMLDYRLSHSRKDTLFHQSDEITEARLQAAGFNGIPQKMTMQMHMLHLMYAPSDWLNIMLMPHFMSMDMSADMIAAEDHGGHGHGAAHGRHEHDVSGLGDTEITALFRLHQWQGHVFNAAVGVSAPTGSVDEAGDDGRMLAYGMQLGSGTWDFVPALSYLGTNAQWSWGAQVGATLPMESENDSGFSYGERYRATTWAAFAPQTWLSGSVRLNYSKQGSISGHYNSAHNHSSPGDFQSNYGGELWHLGLGAKVHLSTGVLAGHQLGLEWLEPIAEHHRGYQLGDDQRLIFRWSKTL